VEELGVKLTEEQIKKIILEELNNLKEEQEGFNCADLEAIPMPKGRYDAMSEEQLLKVMCCPHHWKVYYAAADELDKRNYKGLRPSLKAPGDRPSRRC